MSSSHNTAELERLLRDATHAYADNIEPAPDSWARLRGRANEIDATKSPRRAAWLVRGLAGAAAALVVVVAVNAVLADPNENKVRIDAPPPSPTTVATVAPQTTVATTTAQTTVPSTEPSPPVTSTVTSPLTAPAPTTPPATSPASTTPPSTAPPTTNPGPLTGDLDATFSSERYGIAVTGSAAFVRGGDGVTWTGQLRATVTGPAIGAIHLQIARPFTVPGGVTHITGVCSGTPDATGLVECTGTFSGAANQWAAEFGPGNGTMSVGDSSGGGVRSLVDAALVAS